MTRLLTRKELNRYMKHHAITMCRYAAQGLLPAIRIGRVWRLDTGGIGDLIRTGKNEVKSGG